MPSTETTAPFSMKVERDNRGRITRKTEIVVGGETQNYAYRYDVEGRLAGVDIGYGEAETYVYDQEGRRIESQTIEPEFQALQLKYTKDDQGADRLVNIGPDWVDHDEHGFRCLMERRDGTKERYHYAPDYRLLRVEKSTPHGSAVIDFEHDENGQPCAKYVDAVLAEQYRWHDLIRLAAAQTHGVDMEFHYAQEARVPAVMTRNGQHYRLYYDQVGSLRVVADEHGDVIKEIRYDHFGRVVEDTNPGLHIPIGFAGGLHDRDTGFVRFGYRDYDPRTARFTAKDPIGYAGGDSDLYGYCLDDPVNGIDPMGLWTEVNYYDDNKGHVSVAPGGYNPVGKYPKTTSDISGGKGVFQNETRKPASTVRIRTTPEQEKDMREYLDKAQKSPDVHYKLGSDDCVDAADTVLQTGGVKTPGSDGVWYPSSYIDALRKLHK